MNDDDCIDETDTDYNMDTYDDECNDFREDLAKRTGLSEARVQVRICKLAYLLQHIQIGLRTQTATWMDGCTFRFSKDCLLASYPSTQSRGQRFGQSDSSKKSKPQLQILYTPYSTYAQSRVFHM